MWTNSATFFSHARAWVYLGQTILVPGRSLFYPHSMPFSILALFQAIPTYGLCSMQVRRGKTWEIWSCVMTSGRQMVDTRGVVPNHRNSHLCQPVHWRCKFKLYWCCLPNALGPQHCDGHYNGFEILLSGTNPCVSTVCLYVYLKSSHMTGSPDPSPPYLHAASDQRLEAGTTCERSHLYCLQQITK